MLKIRKRGRLRKGWIQAVGADVTVKEVVKRWLSFADVSFGAHIVGGGWRPEGDGREENLRCTCRGQCQGATAPGPTDPCENKRRHCHQFLSEPVVRRDHSNSLTHPSPSCVFYNHEGADLQRRYENHECCTLREDVNRQTCLFPARCVHSPVCYIGDEAKATV